ncbi:hypothetical protein [Lactiplantibacillus plajomi]|uniref:Uncharacterized protein n=1 Tax=Lactiplantibacillus plajomi TaxID=1457217 RepID=A0ABV6K4V5_9LACO|nr:hypothetical protein [Lactiplantibacillus plajomi]
MQDLLVKRVFQAWQLADSIDGGEVDVRNAKALRQQFDEIEAAFSDETARKKGTNSLVYLGEYNKQALRHEIQQTLFHDDQPIENEDPAVGYSVGLIMGADWQLQSIFIPKVAYFYLQLRGNHVKRAADDKQYRDYCDYFEKYLRREMENQPIDVALQKASRLVDQEFKLKRVNEARLRGILNYTEHQEPALLNSFYGDDLARILAADDDALLTAYVHGRQQQHEDIDKNWAKIDQILQPANLPDGRWPSPDAFFQSLMQQVSINVLRERGGLKADLQTVNGPPGTGKTTLLKDVFADMVVEQAKAMAKLDKPSDGFKKIDQIVLYQKIKFNCFELIPELRGFGVVVSSNNNSAVANIAKDFPNKKEIQQFPDNHQNDYLDQLAKIDYFTDIAKSALQSEQAWGLFAVQMGSQKNQQRVVDAVIKSAKGTTPFKVAVAQGRSADTWQAARKNFQQRLAAVRTAKKDVAAKIKRVRAYDPAKLADLESQLAATTPQPLLNEIQQLRAGVTEQQRAVDAIPKRGGLLFWLPSQRQRARLASQLAELHTQIAAKQTALTNLQQQIDGLKQRIATIKRERQRIETLKRELNADQTYGVTLDYWQQTSADKLQIQVPYNSKRLQAARAELFIAAMRLRKQFICEAEKPVSNAWHVFKERKSLLFPQ